ncbi:hypothetical protein JTB14_008921 [Gonioctena quinquepunctata]|nr:hypothetical protein JTB14_008921 [Gonioctena quinquepunctata]
MDLESTKILVAVLFFVIRFFFGMLPVKLYNCLRRWEGDDGSETFVNQRRHTQVNCAIALCQSFGGGVLFATCFLHMMLEVDKILNSQRDLASSDSLTSSKKIPNILGSDVSRSANNLQKTNEINMVNSEKQRENNESREVLYYKEDAIGPFIVVIESTEKSGNIAQEIPRVPIDNAQDPRDFPRLREKSAPQINRIEISEREETYNKSLSNNKRNYSQILKNKGRNERSGFDRQALNEALFYPNGQIPQPNNGVMFKRNMDENYSGEGPSNIETGHPTINRPISAPQENIKEEQYIIKQFYDLFTEIPENIKPKIINLINSLDIFEDRQNLNASHSSSAEEY